MLLGAAASLLVLAAVQRLRSFRNPYILPLVQALLKIPAGALIGFALIGFLGFVLMQDDVLFLEPQRGSALVAYVIFFGASQDVITRLIDRKARDIAEAANPDAASSGSAGGG